MKLGKDEKDQTEKAAMYDIISSPSKDSTKLTLRLSRVRSSDMDQQDDMLSGLENNSVSEGDIPFNVQYPGQTSKTPVTPQDVNRPLNSVQCLLQHEQTAFLQAQQVPVLQQNTSVAAKQPQTPVVQTQQQVSQQGAISSYDEVELDALAEIERIERESAIERERFSKEVQDKEMLLLLLIGLALASGRKSILEPAGIGSTGQGKLLAASNRSHPCSPPHYQNLTTETHYS
ncbi:nipped-B-like protein [Pitangus sulphuratus]|nr:nipped-B-like protein [Pitangus sulphuratus]